MSVGEIGRKITEVKEERDLNLNLRVRDLETHLIGKHSLQKKKGKRGKIKPYCSLDPSLG
jgi:hypothetical protein